MTAALADRIREVLALSARATPGPWRHAAHSRIEPVTANGIKNTEDAAFITEAANFLRDHGAELLRIVEESERDREDAERWRVFSDGNLAYFREPLVNARTQAPIPSRVRWTIYWDGPDRAILQDAIDAARSGDGGR